MAAKLKALQQWCKQQCEGYHNVNITNMTSSFKNGLAFCAIIHRYRPDLIDYDSLSEDDVFENNKLAFNVAYEHLGIPRLLDPEDMVEMRVPDRLCVITYVSQYLNYFRDKTPGVIPTEKRSTVKRQPTTAPSSKPPDAKKPTTQNEQKEPQKQKAEIRNSMGDTCAICGGKVYIMERHVEGTALYHRHCIRTNQRATLKRSKGSQDKASNSPKAARTRMAGSPAKSHDTKVPGSRSNVGSPTRSHDTKVTESRSNVNKVTELRPKDQDQRSNLWSPQQNKSHNETKSVVSKSPFANQQNNKWRSQNSDASISSHKSSSSSSSSPGISKVSERKELDKQVPKIGQEKNTQPGTDKGKIWNRHVMGYSDSSASISSAGSGQSSPGNNFRKDSSNKNASSHYRYSSPASSQSTLSSPSSGSTALAVRGLAESSNSSTCTSNSSISHSSMSSPDRHRSPNLSPKLTPSSSQQSSPSSISSRIKQFDSSSVNSTPSPTTAKKHHSAGADPDNKLTGYKAALQSRYGSQSSTSSGGSESVQSKESHEKRPYSSAATVSFLGGMAKTERSPTTSRVVMDNTAEGKSKSKWNAHETVGKVNTSSSASKSNAGTSEGKNNANTIMGKSNRDSEMQRTNVYTTPETNKVSAVAGEDNTKSDLLQSLANIRKKHDEKRKRHTAPLVSDTDVLGNEKKITHLKQVTSVSKSSTAEAEESENDLDKLVLANMVVDDRQARDDVGDRTLSRMVVRNSSTSLGKDESKQNGDIKHQKHISQDKSVDKKQDKQQRRSVPMNISTSRDAEKNVKSFMRQGKVDSVSDSDNCSPKVTGNKGQKSIMKPSRPVTVAGLDSSSKSSLFKQQKQTSASESDSDTVMPLKSTSGFGRKHALQMESKTGQGNNMNAFNIRDSIDKTRNRAKSDSSWPKMENSSEHDGKYITDIRETVKTSSPVSKTITKSDDVERVSKDRRKVKSEFVMPQKENEKPEWMLEAERRQKARAGKYEDPELKWKNNEMGNHSPVNSVTKTTEKNKTDLLSTIEATKPGKQQPSSGNLNIAKETHGRFHPEGTAKIFTEKKKVAAPHFNPESPPVSPPKQLKKIRPETKFTFENFDDSSISDDGSSSGRHSTAGRSEEESPRSLRDVVLDDGTRVRKVEKEKRLDTWFIEQKLGDLDVQLSELERQGRGLEEKIRGKESEDDADSEDLMVQWFDLISEKNDLVRKEADLMYIRKQQDLEDRHKEVDTAVRDLMMRPDEEKTDEEREKEKELLAELMELVKERNQIVEGLEEARLRYIEEDQEIQEMLAIKGFKKGETGEAEDHEVDPKQKSKDEKKQEKKAKKREREERKKREKEEKKREKEEKKKKEKENKKQKDTKDKDDQDDEK